MKRIIGLTSVLACLALPVSALADALTITNNTNFTVTSTINPASGGICSSSMPGGLGVTPPHTTKTIPALAVMAACGISHQHDCQAAIHMTPDCSGPAVAMVNFDTSKGIMSVQLIDTSYKVSASGFTAVVDGGPAARA